MALAESVHEQIAEALRVLLQGIGSGSDGAEYWYPMTDQTTRRVGRVSFYRESDLRAPFDHVILIRPGEEFASEHATGDATTGGEVRVNMEVFVEINHRFENPSESPYEETAPDRPSRWTIVNRGVRDVLRKVFFGPGVTLNGLTVNAAMEAIVIDRSQFIEKWARAEIRFVIGYDFMAATP